MKLKFISKKLICSDIWQLHFSKPKDFKHQAGQYLEAVIPSKETDERGNKRWFTISSSPTEKDIIITTRLVSTHSEFKDDLFHLKSGDAISIKGPMGDFVLPTKSTKIIWIAGGIGITPFMSQLQYLIDTQDYDRNIVLIHGLQDLEQNPCSKLLEVCKIKMPKFSLVQVLSNQVPKDWQGATGYINENVIKKSAPDFINRQIYVSGPEPMVDSVTEMLVVNVGADKRSIHQDWFPGYKEKY